MAGVRQGPCGAVGPGVRLAGLSSLAWRPTAVLPSPFGQGCCHASPQWVQPCTSPRATEHPWLCRASLALRFELALCFLQWEEAGSRHSGQAVLPPDMPVQSQQCFSSGYLAHPACLPASFSMSNDTNVLLTLSPALGCSPGRSRAPLSLPRLCLTSEQLPSVSSVSLLFSPQHSFQMVLNAQKEKRARQAGCRQI